ncbi:RING finger protein 17-like isoform X2 [Mercenaria mercenaria]|uniref:RING finger protein 17-like isoform X2 n=1 Tax=Mercenaria mercenaria TaxID=6596 RepID=UPI00234EA44D|nr:RING finger protein 17-like isoform X2 [Mercenaria mercenaria]
MQKCPACPKCSAHFIAKDSGRLHKRPLVLNCGHTFCESCLLQLAREKKTSIICPSCKEETGLLSGESSVKLLCPDRYIMGTVIHNQKTLLEQELLKLKEASEIAGQRRHTSSDRLCKECTKRPATSHCAKCECNMCSVCFQRVHSLSRSLQLHTAVPLLEEGQLEVSQMCKEHENRPIEYYCDDDDMIICSRCVIVGNHKGHNISSIEDKNRCIVNEMEPNLQVANHVFRRLKKIDKEFPLLVPDFKKEMSGVLEDVRAHFQHLHGILQIREHALEQQVLHVVREGLQPIEKLRSDLHNEFKQLDQTIKAAHRIMNNNDEVIVNAKEILEKLAHAKDIPCIIELTESTESTEKIGFMEGPSVDTLLKEYGSICGSVPQRFTMFTLRDKPEKFSEDTDSCVTTPPGSDYQSVTSETTSQGDDVIIEEEQEIVLEDDGAKSVKSIKVAQPSKFARKSLPKKKKFKGQNENVVVTHIQSPCKFMVQLKRDSSKIAVLSHSLQQFCNSLSTKHHMVTGVDVDDIVLAQYSLDNLWYRGRIKHVMEPEDGQFENTNVEISYIDYGNTEVVNVQRLRNMQAKFMKHPEFAIECCLFNTTSKVKDGTWSVEAVQTFAKMVESKVMLLTIVREVNNIMYVDLCKPADDDIVDDRPMSVRDALVFLDLARFESPCSLPEPGGAPAPKRNYLTPTPMEQGQTYCVIVTYAGTPDCFYAQELGDETNYLATMMAHIQDTYNKQMKDTWQIICPSVGMICVSQFSGDGLWYRAKIVDLPGHQDVVVQYIDYGNKETVHVFNLRKIIDSFLVLPAQAIQCMLTDVEPLNANEGWTTECLHYWSEKVLMKKFFLKVIKTNNELSVVLRDLDTEDYCDTLNVKVVEDGMARSVGEWSEPQNITELANEMSDVVPRLSYQAGSGSFPEPCDLGHQPVYWKSRNSKPSRRYEETVLTPPGSPDHTSQPKQHQPKQNQPKQHVEKSTVAQALLQNSPSNQNSVVEKMRSPGKKSPTTTPNKTHASPVRKEIDSDSSTMSSSLTDTGREAGKITTKKSPSMKSKMKSERGSGEKKKNKKIEVEVTVSHFVSPSEYYLQLVSAKDELEALMSEIFETYHNSVMTMTNWSAGNYCVAYSTTTGRWYRAKITKVIQKSLMEVHMLDYGFSEMISTNNLRQVMKQYRKSRAFTFACKLAGVTPAGGMKEWSKTACEFMEANITNKKLFLNQRGNPVDGKLPCDLIIEEYIDETALEPGRKTYHSLIDRLKEKGLAIPIPKKHGEVHDKQKVFPVCYYKKAEAEVKTGDKVMPVYVDYDAVIHCYTMEGDDIFQNMCDVLHQKFNNSEPPGPEQTYEKGQACAAFYEKDGQWHRATVLEIEPTKVKIHFIDYGNSEWVGYEDLRADIEEFTDIPQQTFLCTLHDVRPLTENGKWDLNTLEMIHKDLVNKYCIITVMEKNGYEHEHMTVNIEVNGKDYGTHLVHYGMAQRGDYITDQEMQSAQIEHILQNKNPFKMMTSPELEEMLSVLVTHVELPDIVYIQPSKVGVTDEMDINDPHMKKVIKRNKQLEKLEKLSSDLYHAAPTLPAIPVPHIGLPCCAQFGYDQCWYRAVIITVYQETQQILVLFVDYGNSEIITYNKLRAIPPSYLNLPCQALRCRLSKLKPAANTVSWTKNALVEMMSVVANKPLLAKVVKDDPLRVELYEGSEDAGYVYQSVIDGGYIQLNTSSRDSPVTSPIVKEVVTVKKTIEVNVPEVVVTKAREVNVKTDSESESSKQNVSVVSVAEQSKVAVTTEKMVNDTGATISQITVDSTTDDDRSEISSVSVATVSTTTGEKVSKSSKSWADMAEEGSSLDVDELLEFEDSDQEKTGSASEAEQKKYENEGDQRRSQKEKKKIDPEDRKKTRDSRKVEVVQHEDECFE